MFEFIYNVILSYASSNEFVSLPKFWVMSVVVEQLDINRARLLVNMFIEQTAFIARSFDGVCLVKIESRRILHHRMKISFMLINRLTN